MPYIREQRRRLLDNQINNLIISLKSDIIVNDDKITNESLSQLLGDINYCITRIITNLVQEVSYPKIAMITGVLENVKQEFYRRVASKYEDLKIKENGDVVEYQQF